MAGGRLAVTAPGTSSDPQKRPGAVYVFELCGETWRQALVRPGTAPRVVLRDDAVAVHGGDALVTARLVGGCAGRR